MKLRFTRRAVADIARLADFVNEHSPSAATAVRAAISSSLQTLVMFPRSGRLQNAVTVRKIVTPRFRYRIYYTYDELGEELVVLNVKHPAEFQDDESSGHS